MDDLRDSFSKFKKDIKHRLGGNKRKGDKPGPDGREEGVGSSTSFPQPEPRVSTGGGREQEGSGSNVENENIGTSAAVDENRPDWGSTASSSAKLVLRAVRDSADAFGPLKSVAGGLCFILENCEVRHLPSQAIGKLRCPQRTKANRQTIESLAPRVKELAERLCEPVGEGDVKERERRTRLERWVHAPRRQASVESDTGIRRKLQDVLRDLAPLKRQGKVEGFFNNTENAAQLGGLVEGIRDAMMEYQVCGSYYSSPPRLIFLSDIAATGNLRSATRDLR